MIHEAIYNLYPAVTNIVGDGNNCVAYDAKGNVVSWDTSAVAKKETELLDAYKLEYLRAERNTKLAETDWTQSRDVTLSNDADWKTYRQALRDITKTYKTFDTVKWPTEPTS